MNTTQHLPGVCMIAYTQYPTDGRVRLEAESLARWGHDVSVLVLKSEASPRTYSLCDVTVIELNVRKYRGKSRPFYLFSYLHFLLLAFVRCTWLFFQRGFKVIHVHNMPDLLVFAALIPRMFGCKVVLDIHDSMPETYAGKFGAPTLLFRLLALEEWLCCAFASRVIAVNDVQREAIAGRSVPAAKIVTVVTMPGFTRVPVPLERAGDRFRVVNHGTIARRLGIDLLVQAVSGLACVVPELELHIIGGGDDLDEIAALSRSLGIHEKIHFHPPVPWDALPLELRGMDVGVIANRVNIASDLMLPSKLIDYVSLGIPAVAPRFKAIEHYFTDEMISYFEAEDVESMADAILRLYRDKARRQSQAAMAKSFLEQNGWEKNNGLHRLYGELIEKPALGRGPSQPQEFIE
jgi:glycosyltransferase involved in cell wall biosynthesis